MLPDSCKEEMKDIKDSFLESISADVNHAIEEEIRKHLENVPPEYLGGVDTKNLKMFKGAGCEKCGRTGYAGRFGIFEVLPMPTEIQELLLGKVSTNKIYEAAARLGMITMKQDGIIKVLRGETTMDEIIRVTTE